MPLASTNWVGAVTWVCVGAITLVCVMVRRSHARGAVAPGEVPGLPPGAAPGPARRLAGAGLESDLPKLSPGADAELREHLAQVPFDGAGAEEQLGADRRVGKPARASRAICASWAVSSSRVVGVAFAHRLAGGNQLAAGPFGEPLGADATERIVGGAELLARVDTTAFAPQPFAIQELVRARCTAMRVRASRSIASR